MTRGYQRIFSLTAAVVTLSAWQALASDFAGTERINQLMRTKGIQASASSVVIMDVTTGETLYEHNPEIPVHPASVGKIYTSAAALHYLKPEYTFTTRLMADSSPDAKGIVQGNIYLQAGGDPFMVPEQLYLFADKIVKSGIKGYTGKVIVDIGIWEDEGRPAGWPKNQLSRAYAAPVSPLTFFFNTIVMEMSVPKGGGSALVSTYPAVSHIDISNTLSVQEKSKNQPVMDLLPDNGREVMVVKGTARPGYTSSFPRAINLPVEYFTHSLLDMIEQRGVKVNRELELGTVPAKARRIASHDSQHLRDVVRVLNMYSNNVMAEMLLRHVGGASEGWPGNTEKGLTGVKKFLEEIGCEASGFAMVDGSGLSRGNRVTGALTADMLTRMYQQFDIGPEFMVSLGVSGAEGTLRKRMAADPSYRMVRGKTGTVAGVTSLAGYLETKGKRRLAYAIFMNQCVDASAGRRVIDQICLTARDQN